MSAPGRRVRIGFVRRVHGLKGEIEVQTFDPGSRAVRTGTEVWIVESDEDAAPSRRVLAVRTGKEGVVLRVEGVDDRTAAETLKGRAVEVERASLPKPPEGEFYLVDLIGYRVETADGRLVGELEGALDSGGPRLLQIASEGRRLLVPAVPQIVLRVEHERRVVVIDPPDGLLDL